VALGARAADVMRLVLRQAVIVAAAGVVLGLAGAAAGTRILRSLLLGTSATDPLTFAAVTLLLCAVVLAASFVPARRAARIDPMAALRAE
jgi:putative ABC transport system permease protein